jgi:hypothetical protein
LTPTTPPFYIDLFKTKTKNVGSPEQGKSDNASYKISLMLHVEVLFFTNFGEICPQPRAGAWRQSWVSRKRAKDEKGLSCG